ncbi:MAG: hypothetical protein M0Z36_11670, partial [Thermaerobacter sp.]|nr:hypothetical protein [Thermaerobacter sp.]
MGNGAPAVEPSPTALEGLDVDLAHLDREYITATYRRGFEAIVALITALVGLVQRVSQDNQALRHQLHRDS